MLVLLGVPKPELSFQALPGTGADLPLAPLPKAPWGCKATKAKPWARRISPWTLSCRLGHPPGAAFSEPPPLKHGKQGKSGGGTLCLWLLPAPAGCSRDGRRRPGSVPSSAATTLTQWNGKAAGIGVGSHSGPWLNRVFISPVPCLLRDASTDIPAGQKVSDTHQKLITENPNELELSSHQPPTQPMCKMANYSMCLWDTGSSKGLESPQQPG